jgi:hypothetical protein
MSNTASFTACATAGFVAGAGLTGALLLSSHHKAPAPPAAIEELSRRVDKLDKELDTIRSETTIRQRDLPSPVTTTPWWTTCDTSGWCSSSSTIYSTNPAPTISIAELVKALIEHDKLQLVVTPETTTPRRISLEPIPPPSKPVTGIGHTQGGGAIFYAPQTGVITP